MSRCFIVFLTNQKDYEPFSAANNIAVVCGVWRSVAGWCNLGEVFSHVCGLGKLCSESELLPQSHAFGHGRIFQMQLCVNLAKRRFLSLRFSVFMNHELTRSFLSACS